MSVEIHAAVVGGVLAGGGVLVGVLVGQLVRDAGERRRRLTEVFLELEGLLPQLVGLMAIASADGSDFRPPDSDVYRRARDEYHDVVGRAERLLAEMRTLARWPRRRSKRLRAEIDDLYFRLVRAQDRVNQGHRYGIIDLSDELSSGGLAPHVVPSWKPIRDRLQQEQLLDQGSGGPEPPKEEP